MCPPHHWLILTLLRQIGFRCHHHRIEEVGSFPIDSCDASCSRSDELESLDSDALELAAVFAKLNVALLVALFGLAEVYVYCLAKWKWRFIGMFWISIVDEYQFQLSIAYLIANFKHIANTNFQFYFCLRILFRLVSFVAYVLLSSHFLAEWKSRLVGMIWISNTNANAKQIQNTNFFLSFSCECECEAEFESERIGFTLISFVALCVCWSSILRSSFICVGCVYWLALAEWNDDSLVGIESQ